MTEDEMLEKRKACEESARRAINDASKNYQGLAATPETALLFSVTDALWGMYCAYESAERALGELTEERATALRAAEFRGYERAREQAVKELKAEGGHLAARIVRAMQPEEGK